ncbi:hypothetical protein F4780DRAFT_722943 [Xylariomycetidae sp. FL0641]|nr:hypothetical protein F4780DRAFT_722943 [Xylariomycetidae sp. FL0641]
MYSSSILTPYMHIVRLLSPGLFDLMLCHAVVLSRTFAAHQVPVPYAAFLSCPKYPGGPGALGKSLLRSSARSPESVFSDA